MKGWDGNPTLRPSCSELDCLGNRSSDICGPTDYVGKLPSQLDQSLDGGSREMNAQDFVVEFPPMASKSETSM